MRTDITCALGGVSLHELDSRIYVEDIKEDTAIDMQTSNRARYGLFPLTNPEHQSLTITVTAFVKEKNRVDRMAVIQKIRGWAGQGWLTTSDRPGLRLYVFCTKINSVESFDITNRIEIEFSAYGEAYWQETSPVTVSVSSAVSSDIKSITPRGTQDCFLEAQITPSGGTLTSVSISVGSQTLALSGLSVASGETLKISYDELHLLSIKKGSTSYLSKRTAASVDDINLSAGVANSVSLTFDTACTYTLTARGLWK